MLTASVENLLIIRIGTTLESGIVPTQYIGIVSTVRRHSVYFLKKSNKDSFKLILLQWKLL